MDSPYLPSDRWFQGDPDAAFVGRAFWVTIERQRDRRRWVELLSWFGPPGYWGTYQPGDLHFTIIAYQRADLPAPYFL